MARYSKTPPMLPAINSYQEDFCFVSEAERKFRSPVPRRAARSVVHSKEEGAVTDGEETVTIK